MMHLVPKTHIDFVGKRFIFFAFSAAITVGGLLFIYFKGLNLGLDFTGGTLVQVQFSSPVLINDIRGAMHKAGLTAEIQTYMERNSFAIRVKGKQENVNTIGGKIQSALKSAITVPFTEDRVEYVGPTVGRDLSQKAIFAVILAMLCIIIYIAFRFKNPVWGTMGVVALIHDILVALTAMSITGRQVDLVVVAALLTIAGYSINDTVVIFDRMRENLRLHPRMPLGEMINLSVNECIPRTIITTLTVFATVLILFLFGGEAINDFSFCMLIGTVTGVYSTLAIAAPLVYEWHKRFSNAAAAPLPQQAKRGQPRAENKKA